MTVRELFDYLMECCDKGFDNADVFVCDERENPMTESICVVSALRIEKKDGDKSIIIQTV